MFYAKHSLRHSCITLYKLYTNRMPQIFRQLDRDMSYAGHPLCRTSYMYYLMPALPLTCITNMYYLLHSCIPLTCITLKKVGRKKPGVRKKKWNCLSRPNQWKVEKSLTKIFGRASRGFKVSNKKSVHKKIIGAVATATWIKASQWTCWNAWPPAA